jgi:hypothetical protein
MKVGQEVRLVLAEGETKQATITGVPGAGPSLSKLLDLEYTKDGERQQLLAVPHERDAAQDSPFWLLRGERRTRAPEDEPVEDTAPVADTVAFPEPALGAPAAPATPRPPRER